MQGRSELPESIRQRRETEMTKTQRKLLADCSQALNDWMVTYASEMAGKKEVASARKRIKAWGRIKDGDGTLAYAADLRARIKKALK